MINRWLDEFKESWKTKDIDRILSLFTNDVEYWETPYQLVRDKVALRQEWSAIHGQKEVELDFEVFSSADNKHSVLWKLSYENEKSEIQNWSGIYLIELGSAGKCKYFYQTGEKL